jgi:PPOX class probable F420-dependent enzyme
MLEPAIRDLAREKNFAALTVLTPSGQPMTQVMWVDADDDHVLINTEVHRYKYQAIQRDPRATVMVWDATDPYRYAEVRGKVVGEVRGPEARGHIDRLAERYTGKPYAAQIQSERVILQIAPDRQYVRG